MAHLRFLVSIGHSADPLAKNLITNTFFLSRAAPFGDPDIQGLCDDAAALFATFRSYPNNINEVRVKAYDMDDAKPRPIRGNSLHAIAGVVDPAPREVCLCLSFFSQRNLPRRRGRLYIGPYAQNVMVLQPAAPQQNDLGVLAQGLADLGGVDIDWVVHSVVDNTYNSVSDWWVDNEWDTQRSRGLEADQRISGTVGE